MAKTTTTVDGVTSLTVVRVMYRFAFGCNAVTRTPRRILPFVNEHFRISTSAWKRMQHESNERLNGQGKLLLPTTT